MKTYILRENCLSDDTLYLSKTKFKGGFTAIVEKYSYLNHWQDQKEIFRFRSLNSLNKFLQKHYPNINLI